MRLRRFLALISTAVMAGTCVLGNFSAVSAEDTSESGLNNLELKSNVSTCSLPSSGTFWIVNAHSGKVLDVDNAGISSGTNVLQWRNKNGSNQKWLVTYNSSGNYYTIKPTHTSNLYLSTSSTNVSNGVNACVISGSSSSTTRWTITQNNTSNGNYVIRSKSDYSFALTTENARTDDGANVFMYKYSSGNNCNDEWIFVNSSGYTPKNVKIAIQEDKSYLLKYNSQPNEINKTFADASKPFYSKWHIEFTPSYYSLSSMKLEDCPNGYTKECNTANCGEVCKNVVSSPNHHKNFDYNALNAWKTYGTNGNRIRLIVVGIQLCHNVDGKHKNNALGWWPSGFNGMVQQNRSHMLNVRVIQHELSHAYGAEHCNGSMCIMNGGYDNNYAYNLSNIWCSSCSQKFSRTRY